MKMIKTINQLQKENSVRDQIRSVTDHTKEFYQTYRWRKIREAYRYEMRSQHEKIIFDVYESSIDNNDPADLLEFIFDEKKYPLSEMSLKQGIIKRATVCDHIIPRRIYRGDNPDNEKNLQWLTFQEHKRKTIQENKKL